ncbi:MAG: RDD family protein [Dehalococcoidia bacterium]
MTTSGAPPPSGHPGPRWGGDGSLGGGAADTAAAPHAPRDLDAGAGEGDPAGVALRDVRRRFAVETDRPYAGFWRRFGAWVVDEALKTAFWIAIIVMVVFVTGRAPASTSGTDVSPLALLPRLMLSAGYDWIFWAQGWTPGALVLRIRIVRADGAPPGHGRAAMRVAVSALSSAAFFIGYLWMLRSRRRQTWHDMAAGTYVVMAPDEAENPDAPAPR